MFYLIKDGKLCAGPVWDFDKSFGNDVNYSIRDVRYNTYFLGYGEKLMAASPEFRELIREEFAECTEAVDHLLTNIGIFQNDYANSLHMTPQRFPEANQGSVDYGCNDANIAYLVGVTEARIKLIRDIMEYPDEYALVTAGGGSIWIKKGDTLTEELIRVIKNRNGWEKVTYPGGEAISIDDPVCCDLVLSGS